MEYQVDGNTIGFGDDVLQLFDIAATTDIGRHRQTEALVRGEPDIDLRLVMDECAVVIDDESQAAPVRQAARRVLEVMGVDPDGPIRRDRAGQPTLRRLKRIDRRQEITEKAKQQAVDTAGSALEKASQGMSRAQQRLEGTVRRRRR